MGDIGHGVALQEGNRIPEDSVTGVGGPVLLAASAPELGRGDVLAGRYQIEALIGSGGSGRVLRAFDRVARAAVALKILRPEYVSDPLWTERFSRELRVGRQIQHRNVCRVFDIGDADGQRFLSMELATRGTIRGEIGDAALKRPLEDRLTDARAVVAGAAALHAAGIIHRDLKPENILRMEDGR
ncbi:MAG: protein kinase, partial [Myxococcales bacterium]